MNILKKMKNLILNLLYGDNRVDYLCKNDVLPSPLSKEEEDEAVAGMLNGDDKMKDKLIEHNLRLVVYIAKKFDNSGVDADDLISVGTIGLIKAVKSFNSDKNIKLATYASRCIENEILMYLRRIVKQKNEISFDEPLNTDCDGNQLLLSDVLGTDTDMVYANIEASVESDLLKTAIKTLNKRELEIMNMRFGLDGGKEKTQKEVADTLGISQSYISRLEKKIIKKLKKEFVKMS